MSSNDIIIAADFETTVYDNQQDTEVWAAAYCELGSENVVIRGSMKDFLNDLFSYHLNIIVWFHNLKFDGSFILDYLLRNRWRYDKPNPNDKGKLPRYSKTFRCLISSKNRFYVIQLNYRKQIITFYDSVKLFPFELRQAAKAFNTRHQKLDMEYKGYRYANCPRTPAEDQYIANDVLVLKEILEIFYERGHTRMTIGSNCVYDFKRRFDKFEYNALFPDLKAMMYKAEVGLTVDRYVRETYRGAWCYVHKSGEVGNGATFDVNSLYPFVMHSSSGHYYPVGFPHFFKDVIPEKCSHSDVVWFIHIKCKFKLKEGYLPTIQIKRNFLYNPREFLKTSNFIYRGQEYEYLIKNGEKYYARPDLYLTMRDYQLLMTHYEVTELEIIDGCWFSGLLGIFDDYIDEWMTQKENAANKVERTEAKLFLNNLYGKFATSDDSSYQIPYLADDKLAFNLINEHNKNVFYIPVGSMITAYARYYTITHAQQNYDNFCYADTDSLHCTNPDEIRGLTIHPTKLGAWKRESDWSKAIFIRAKTYAEFIRKEDGEKVYPHWKITCAGMPERCKKNFLATHPITDFKYGLKVKGKLIPKRIKGGIILEETEYTLRK